MYAAYVPLFPPPSSVVVADLFVTSMSAWSRPSSSSVSGDGFWKRALSGLPVALADGLRTAELDDPTVLSSYPRMDWEEAVLGLRALSCTMSGGIAPAPSGAASSGQPTTSSLHLASTSLSGTSSASAGTTTASLVGDVGTDPKTGYSGLGSTKGTDPKTGLSSVGMHVDVEGGDPRTDHFVPSGGDVKTDHFVPSGGDVKTDHFVPSGGDVKTDQVHFSEQMVGVFGEMEMAATCPPYRPGRLASATALSNSSATASAVLAAVDELSDGFPCSPVCRDELPSSASEANPDGSSLLDRILQRRHSIGILQGIQQK